MAACADALRELYGRGLITVSAPATIVSAGLTQHPDEWITLAGWRVLRPAELDDDRDIAKKRENGGDERPL